MTRKSSPLSCSPECRRELEKLAADSNSPRLAQRARMILMCLESRQINMIAKSLNERPNTIIFWKSRFREGGVEALRNLPRGRQNTVYGQNFLKQLKETLDSRPPEGHPRWSGALLARTLGVPEHVVWRYLRKEGIHLTRQRIQEQ